MAMAMLYHAMAEDLASYTFILEAKIAILVSLHACVPHLDLQRNIKPEAQ